MGYAILRAEPRTISGAAAMLSHALREEVPANAVPGSEPPQLLAGVETSGQAMQQVREAIDEAKAAKKYQKTVKPVLDILVTFSHKDGEKLSENEQQQYFRKALDFVSNKFGGAENVLCAAVHRDESTPHIQIIMLARDNDTKKLGCSQFMGNKTNLHKMQNEFWEECGKPFGLLRGEPRTGAKNLPVRVLYGALSKGAEIPSLVEVPEVSLKDKIFNPEKINKREKAIEHNKHAIEELRYKAGVGDSIHPTLIEQESVRYRAAIERTFLAEREAKRSEARAEEARAAARAEEARIEQQRAAAREEAAKLQEKNRGYEHAIKELDKILLVKGLQYQKISKDVENIRAIRDQEKGSDYEM